MNTYKTFLPCWNAEFFAFHIKILLLSLHFVNLLLIILQIVFNIYCSNNTFASFFSRYWPCNNYFDAYFKTTFCRFLCPSQTHQYPYCFCDKHNYIHNALEVALLLVYIMPSSYSVSSQVGLCDSSNTKYPSCEYIYILCVEPWTNMNIYVYISLFNFFVMSTMYKWVSDGLRTLRASLFW